MENRNSTLKAIADRLGLNVATVSRALHGSPLVRPETRDQVLNVAAELRYRPNKSARNLVQGRNGTRFIGVLIPDLIHQFFFGVLKGIVQELKSESYSLMVFNIASDRATVVNRIMDEAPDGLMVFFYGLEQEERQHIRECRFPFVYVDYMSPVDPCCYMDNFEGGRIAATYLLERGVRRPFFVGTTADTQQQRSRLEGFSSVFAAEGISDIGKKFIEIEEPASCALTTEILEADSYDGIFYFCDELAYGGIKAIRQTGKCLPIVGYDDLPMSEILRLSTVRQDSEQLGRSSASLMIDLVRTGTWTQDMDPGSVGSKIIKLSPQLIVRDT
jgi:LacI family transcriptional regulator